MDATAKEATMDNMASYTRQNDCRVSPISEDTAHVSAWVGWENPGEWFDRLETAKQEAQNGAESDDGESFDPQDPDDYELDAYGDYVAVEGSPAGCVEIGGNCFKVAPQGAGGTGGRPYYAYKLMCGGVNILIRRSDGDGKIPNMRIEMGSVPLAQMGGVGPLYEAVKGDIAKAGGTITKEILSRVDIYTDVAGVPVGEFCRRFRDGWRVTRARKFSTYAEGEEEERFAEYGVGRADTGFSIGRNTQLRVYDKIREMRQDPVKQDVFAQRYGGELPAVLTRVEFQLRRDAIAKVKVGEKNAVGEDEGRINTVADWLQYRASVWDYLTSKGGDGWFRLTDRPVDSENRHQERAATWPVWAMVSGANGEEAMPRERLKVRMVKRSGPIVAEQLELQSLSTGIKAGVMMGLTFETLEDVAIFLGSLVQRYPDKVQAMVARHKSEHEGRLFHWDDEGEEEK